MTRLYIFADDSMQGREVGTPGNVKGTDYIAAEAQRIGLKPAGDNGTFFQTLPLTIRAFAPSTSLRITGGDSIPLFDGFLPVSDDSIINAHLPVWYAGQVGVASPTRAQMEGKLVVFTVDRNDPQRLPNTDGAAAVALVVLDAIPKSHLRRLREPMVSMPHPPRPRREETTLILITEKTLATLFGKPLAELKPGTAGSNVDFTVFHVERPAPYPGRNVVAILPGSDPVLSHQYVAIGAHNDHIGMSAAPLDHDSVRVYNHTLRIEGADQGPRTPTDEQRALLEMQRAQLDKQQTGGVARPDSIFNGADDDGSGSVSVLEIAEHLAAMPVKPKRSILFVWHVGEEKGLWGSEWFTDHPTVPRDSIVTQLNIDMIGRGDANDIVHGGPHYLQLVGSRRLSTELGDLIEQVNKNDHHDFTFDYTFDAPGHPQQIYCRSDHYSYARYGIPVTFFTTGGHPDYHQITDEPEYIDYEHMARVASLISDVAVHVANLSHAPVVDHRKPNPHGSCTQ